MKVKMKYIFIFLMLVLPLFFVYTQNNSKNSIQTTQENLNYRSSDLKSTGFWDNFTYIEITDLNWSIASNYNWCFGNGTLNNPYIIQNMVINASDSPIGCGILIENSTNVYYMIKNITIFDGASGIKLENTNKGTLTNNILSNNTANAIYMNNSVNNTIIGNHMYNNDQNGIYCGQNCNENLIYNNTIKCFSPNLQDNGIYFGNSCDKNIISSNSIENKILDGLSITNCNGISILNNHIIDISSLGMFLLWDPQLELINNTISGGSNSGGILISACWNGNITGNFINKTTSYALEMEDSCYNNTLHNNIFKDNTGTGVNITDPSDYNNLFYLNSFISNGNNVFDNGTNNFWNNTQIGNYWDNYTGSDSNNDYIGDIPFFIPGRANSNDSLPIVYHGLPSITINSPTTGDYNVAAPKYNIAIRTPYIYSMWYTINGSSAKKYYFTSNGTINSEAWNALSNGSLNLNFYAQDYALSVGSASVSLVKGPNPIYNNGGSNNSTSSNGNNSGSNNSTSKNNTPNSGTTPPNITLIIIISSIIVIALLTAGILIKVLPNKGKLQKSRMLVEEQSSEVKYFKDITGLLTVLAIHKETGLCLSKFALHGGAGLDEHLFTGFISAIGSFKNELAKQMGLQVEGKVGGGNVIEYNEFTITLMDGNYLRLGLVSHNKLGDIVKEKCGRVLLAYETKHEDELKNFEGDLQAFEDFKETIETGLDLYLNTKCTIDVKKLNNFRGSKSLKKILNDFKTKPDGFYPIEIFNAHVQDNNISDEEATKIVYEAFKNQILIPQNLPTE